MQLTLDTRTTHQASICARAATANNTSITRQAYANNVIQEYLGVPSVAAPWITTYIVTSVGMVGSSRTTASATTASFGTINAIGVTQARASTAALAGHYGHLVLIIVFPTCSEHQTQPTITIILR